MASLPPHGGVVEYRYTYFLVLLVAALSVFSVGAIALTVGSFADAAGAPRAVAILWLAIYAWNVYWFAFRIAYAVRLDGGRLSWKALLSRHSVALNDVRAMRPAVMSSNVQVVEILERRPVLLWAGKGLSDFGDELKAAAPHVEVRFGWQARLAERLGPSVAGWRRQDR